MFLDLTAVVVNHTNVDIIYIQTDRQIGVYLYIYAMTFIHTLFYSNETPYKAYFCP